MVWNTCWPTGNVGTPLSHCTLANTIFFLKILSILIGEGRVLLVLKSAFLLFVSDLNSHVFSSSFSLEPVYTVLLMG